MLALIGSGSLSYDPLPADRYFTLFRCRRRALASGLDAEAAIQLVDAAVDFLAHLVQDLRGRFSSPRSALAFLLYCGKGFHVVQALLHSLVAGRVLDTTSALPFTVSTSGFSSFETLDMRFMLRRKSVKSGLRGCRAWSPR